MLQPFGALPPPQRLAKRASGAAHFTGRNFRGRSLCEEPVLWQSPLQISNPVHAVISSQGCDLSVTFTRSQSTRAWFDSLKKKLKVTTSPNLLCEWWEILPGRHIEIVSTAIDNLTIKGLHNINRSYIRSRTSVFLVVFRERLSCHLVICLVQHWTADASKVSWLPNSEVFSQHNLIQILLS